jgi:hypothetical protein
MKNYEFTLVLADTYSVDKFIGLLNSCHKEFADGLLSCVENVCYIDLGREALCLEDAIKSALASAKVVGVNVSHVRLNCF